MWGWCQVSRKGKFLSLRTRNPLHMIFNNTANLHFNGHFRGEPRSSSSTCCGRETLVISGTGFTGWMDALPVTQPRVAKQWKKLEALTSSRENYSQASSFLYSPPDSWKKRRCSNSVGCQAERHKLFTVHWNLSLYFYGPLQTQAI